MISNKLYNPPYPKYLLTEHNVILTDEDVLQLYYEDNELLVEYISYQQLDDKSFKEVTTIDKVTFTSNSLDELIKHKGK